MTITESFQYLIAVDENWEEEECAHENDEDISYV